MATNVTVLMLWNSEGLVASGAILASVGRWTIRLRRADAARSTVWPVTAVSSKLPRMNAGGNPFWACWPRRRPSTIRRCESKLL